MQVMQFCLQLQHCQELSSALPKLWTTDEKRLELKLLDETFYHSIFLEILESLISQGYKRTAIGISNLLDKSFLNEF